MKEMDSQALVHVGIILVGSELLDGRIADRHTQWIAHQLRIFHATVVEVVIVSDDSTMLFSTLTRMAQRHGLIICCGGLGPTQDDITRDVLSTFWQCNIEYDSTPPVGFVFLPNDVGTVYGLYGTKDDVRYLVLPGPPSELRPMVQHYAMHHLQQDIAIKQGSLPLVLTILFVPESVLDVKVHELKQQHPTYILGWATRMGEWSTELVVYLNHSDNARDIIKELRVHFGAHCVHESSTTLGQKMLTLLAQRNTQLISIESCTGGMFAQSIVEVNGASDYFVAGVIPYTVQAKIALGVKAATIDKYGTVSKEVAEELVHVTHEQYNNTTHSTATTRLYIAITGVCGPTESENGVKVGNACIALGVVSGNQSKLIVQNSYITIAKIRPRRRMQQLMTIRMFETVFKFLS